ncbi:MAG: methyltransferase [Candidatus Aenigmatarchaeota archaeon]
MKTKIVSLEKIMKDSRVSRYSPPILIAKELGLKYLVVEEENITGPAIGTSILVDKITRNIKIEKMLDLCCGSGAITKIAIKNGVKISVCIDKNLKAAKENLKNEEKKIILEKRDIFSFKNDDNFELIVLDPPRYLIEKVIHKFSFDSLKTHLFVMWHGSYLEEEWNFFVRNILRKFFDKVYSFSIYGEELSICSKTKLGGKMLKKIFRRW